MKKDSPDKEFVMRTRRWLRDIGKDRNWLAEELRLSPNTISSWLHSWQAVPKRQKAFVEALMKEYLPESLTLDEAIKRQGLSQILIKADEEFLDDIARAAAISGYPLSYWIHTALKKQAKITFQEELKLKKAKQMLKESGISLSDLL